MSNSLDNPPALVLATAAIVRAGAPALGPPGALDFTDIFQTIFSVLEIRGLDSMLISGENRRELIQSPGEADLMTGPRAMTGRATTHTRPGLLLLSLTQHLGGGRPLELAHWQTVRAGDQYAVGAILELPDVPGVLWRIERIAVGPWVLAPEEVEGVGGRGREGAGAGRRATLRLVG